MPAPTSRMVMYAFDLAIMKINQQENEGVPKNDYGKSKLEEEIARILRRKPEDVTVGLRNMSNTGVSVSVLDRDQDEEAFAICRGFPAVEGVFS